MVKKFDPQRVKGGFTFPDVEPFCFIPAKLNSKPACNKKL